MKRKKCNLGENPEDEIKSVLKWVRKDTREMIEGRKVNNFTKALKEVFSSRMNLFADLDNPQFINNKKDDENKNDLPYSERRDFGRLALKIILLGAAVLSVPQNIGLEKMEKFKFDQEKLTGLESILEKKIFPPDFKKYAKGLFEGGNFEHFGTPNEKEGAKDFVLRITEGLSGEWKNLVDLRTGERLTDSRKLFTTRLYGYFPEQTEYISEILTKEREAEIKRIKDLVDSLTKKHGISPYSPLIFAILKQESGLGLRMRSFAGARGLGQIMEDTYKEFGPTDDNNFDDAYDYDVNVKTGHNGTFGVFFHLKSSSISLRFLNHLKPLCTLNLSFR